MITVQTFQIFDCNFLGSTAKLRRYYDGDWTDENGIIRLGGSVGSPLDFFDEIPLTLVGHTLTVPQFQTPPTLTAKINANVRETWQLWDQGSKPRNLIAEDWFIPASPSSTTREILDILNQGQSLLWPPPTYLNAVQVQQLINAQIGGLQLQAKGRVALVATPDGSVATVSTPYVVGSAPNCTSIIHAVGQDDDVSGHLRIRNQVNGVSFDIVSDNGADSGIAGWTLWN
jgi:hypothetical protein